MSRERFQNMLLGCHDENPITADNTLVCGRGLNIYAKHIRMYDTKETFLKDFQENL